MKFLRQAEAEYPAFSSVLCVLKAWLAKKGLRGVYKGGIGSYRRAAALTRCSARRTTTPGGGGGGEAAGTERRSPPPPRYP